MTQPAREMIAGDCDLTIESNGEHGLALFESFNGRNRREHEVAGAYPQGRPERATQRIVAFDPDDRIMVNALRTPP